MNKIPPKIREELLSSITELADRHGYLSRNRPENHQFMLNLMENPAIGKRIESYLGASKVKTYIKDSLLHKYAENKRQPSKTASYYLTQSGLRDFQAIVNTPGKPELFKLSDGKTAAVVFTSYKKWETGVRSLVLYIAGKPRLLSSRPELYLIIFDPKCHVCESDKNIVITGLKLLGIKAIWDVLS